MGLCMFFILSKKPNLREFYLVFIVFLCRTNSQENYKESLKLETNGKSCLLFLQTSVYSFIKHMRYFILEMSVCIYMYMLFHNVYLYVLYAVSIRCHTIGEMIYRSRDDIIFCHEWAQRTRYKIWNPNDSDKTYRREIRGKNQIIFSNYLTQIIELKSPPPWMYNHCKKYAYRYNLQKQTYL